MSTKRKLPSKLGQPVVKPSAKATTKLALDESHTVVSGGGQSEASGLDGKSEPIEISSDEDSSDGEGEAESLEITVSAPANTHDTSMADSSPENDEDANAEPSFGDLVRTTLTEPIDVSAPFAPALSHAPNNFLAAPSSASLSTVLTQALKTNDTTLLESCLQTTDLPTIRATIQRLSSPLASSLLSVLATRLHRRPGRAGSLMVWIQWTLVSHGGYLATQKELIKQLAALNRVIDERARGLQGLLMLKGKLDMLEAQGQLRRAIRGRGADIDEDEDDDDEEGVVYVEGEPDSDDEFEVSVNVGGTSSKRRKVERDMDDDEEEEEDMPNTSNGLIIASSDDEEESDEGLIDDEAEETDDDSGDEDEVDFDDEDEMESGEESDDAAPARSAPPSKMQKSKGLFSKK